MGKRVAVIGAGCSGLVAIKTCLEEDVEPVCFERTGELGGLWRFTEEVEEEQGCVMRSTVINTSKEMMSYSDFPIPKEFPNFLHQTQVWSYFKLYSKQFDLNKHILYNREVLSVQKTDEFDSTGKWLLRVRNHMTGSEENAVFDAVMVCTGHHSSRNVPHFRGQENFKGKIIHSHEYKDWNGYMGKRVVVIGLGNSGSDIAVELSRIGQVYLSTRRGAWVINRVGDNGIPSDYIKRRRFTEDVNSVLPTWYKLWVAEGKANKRFDHEMYSLKPLHRISGEHPAVNDDLANRIACGGIVVKTDISRFTENGVEFIDGTSVDNIDVIILATGYIIGFPFIPKSVIDVERNKVQLYKYMFPPDLKQNTMAVIGCIQPLGAIMPISELQCRVAVRVFKGVCSLPCKEAMWCDIREKETAMAARYIEALRHTIQVEYIDFMDQLADMIGVKPHLGKLLLSDPTLACRCYFGPCTPYQYRLTGPGHWSGAREAIMTQFDRVSYPLKTRPISASSGSYKEEEKHLSFWFIIAMLPVAIAAILKLFLSTYI